MKKLLERIAAFQAVWWVVLGLCGVISTVAIGTWNVADRNRQITATAEQLQEVKTVAATAATTAASAASEVTRLQASVARADDKLDTILKEQGSTSGKLDLLIQLQTKQASVNIRSGIPRATPYPRKTDGTIFATN